MWRTSLTNSCRSIFPWSSMMMSFPSHFSSAPTNQEFKPERVLLLTKLTRLEYEKLMWPDLTEEQLKKRLKTAGSDYDGLQVRHKQHKDHLEELMKALSHKPVDVRVVNRFQYTRDNIDWADAVISAGGDGTFLLAANAIITSTKPLIGFNSDPIRSEGFLCMPKRCSYNVDQAMDELFTGQFRWLWRQRINVSVQHPADSSKKSSNVSAASITRNQCYQPLETTMCTSAYNNEANNKNGMVDLADVKTIQLPHTTRFHEHVEEDAQLREEMADRQYQQLNRLPKATADLISNSAVAGGDAVTGRSVVLPLRALNEVFVGEALSARVSYYEMSVDGGPCHKQKSSGVTLCTGTGSSSWHLHINQLSQDSVHQLLRLAEEHCSQQLQSATCGLTRQSQETLQKITQQFNSSFYFDPEQLVIGYSVRDPVRNGVFQVSKPKGFAKEVVIRSRMWDGHLVVDGGSCYPFNEGAVARFSISPEDALCCVSMRP